MDLKNIGNNIKRLRIKKGLTQSQLAEKADISTVHMSHIETGSVAMSLDSLINISNGLESTPNNILLGEFSIVNEEIHSLTSEYTKKLTSDENRFIIEVVRILDELKINRK